MQVKIVKSVCVSQIYYDNRGNELFSDDYTFVSEPQTLASSDVAPQDELLNMLPWGAEFDVAINANGNIVTHPHGKIPLTRHDYEDLSDETLKSFIKSRYEYQGLSIEKLFVTFPKEATKNNYEDYL